MFKQDPSSPRFTGISTFFKAPFSTSPETADIGIVGIPYDGGTTNRPGARHGPRAVREASTMVAQESPETGSRPFSDRAIADFGDIVPPEPFDLEPALKQIEDGLHPLHKKGLRLLCVGGDHSITLPVLRSLRRTTTEPLALVHVDAHCDTGTGYMGSRFHHGAPFAVAVEEGLIDPRRAIQIGIRGPMSSVNTWRFSHEQGMKVIQMEEFEELGPRVVANAAKEVAGEHPCYLSFDIDSLDPAFAPGTGTPVIGGLTSREAIRLIRGLSGLKLVGADVVEVLPAYDVAGITALAAATIAFEILCQLSLVA